MGNLTEYVDYVKSLNESKIKLAELDNEKGVLDLMNSILRKSFKSKDMNTFSATSNENNVLQLKYESIVEESDKLAKEIITKEALVEEAKPEMILVLDKNIVDVKEKMTELISKIDVGSFVQVTTPSTEACSDLERLKKNFDQSRKRAESYMTAQQVLTQPVTPMEEIAQFDKLWEARYKLWKTRDNWEQDHRIWFEENYKDQKALEIEQKIKEYEKDNIWLKQNLPKEPKDEVLEKLTEDVRGTASMKDLILDLGNEALLERHWTKIFSFLAENNTYSPSRTFTLSELIADGILEVKDKVSEISATASGEYAISQTLEEIKKVWATMDFVVMQYRDFKDKFILGTIEEIMIQLEDDQVSIQTMLGSKNVQEIRSDVEEWEFKLSYISDVIDDWLACQRQWMYLENIFSAEDIQKQLPNESKLFQKVDRFWRDIMAKTHRNPSILETCASQGLLKRFQSNNKMLDDIQKCLEDYLETKRAAFPRFYFLSNDELLQILSQTRNPKAVQPHLRKCFDNMASIVFNENNSNRGNVEIVAMISADGEEVSFSEPVMAQGPVEFWLTEIEKMMVKSLYDHCKTCYEDYPEDALERREWFFTYPAQLVLIIDQVFWTNGCTAAIEEIEKGKNKKALEEWLEFSIAQIGKMVEIVRGNLTEHQRTLMGALIVLDVHAREVVKKMCSVKVNNVNNFEWSKQLRYYWEQEDDDCFARQTNTRFKYGYEFLGNGPRLVITPLTDK